MSILESTDVKVRAEREGGVGAQGIDPENVNQQAEDLQQREDEERSTLARSLIKGTTPEQQRREVVTKYVLYGCMGSGWTVAVIFVILYLELTFRQTGGEILPTPVVLKIAVKNYTENIFFKRIYISGNDTTLMTMLIYYSRVVIGIVKIFSY